MPLCQKGSVSGVSHAELSFGTRNAVGRCHTHATIIDNMSNITLVDSGTAVVVAESGATMP
jgi:hypothetical protein